MQVRLATFAALLTIGLLAVSCQPGQKLRKGDYTVSYRKLDGAEDSAYAAKLAPYRRKLSEQMNTQIAVARGDFEVGRPEGTLNNLVADILRRWSSHVSKSKVHIGLVNIGGLRTTWKAGPLRVGDIFEMMPFDNRVVLLQFNGNQVQQLADELAAKGGEGISGIRFTIKDNKATDLLIGARHVTPDSLYWLACSDYIADNATYLKVMQSALKRIDLDLLVRDAIMDYIRSKEEIEPVLDGRVRKP